MGSVQGVFLGIVPGAHLPSWRPHLAPIQGTAVVSSPVIAPDGRMYVGSDDGNLYALSPSGHILWKFATGGYVQSSPAITANGTVVFGSFDQNLYAVSPTGSELWAYNTTGKVFSSPAVGPAGVVYVGSEDGSIYALNPNGSLEWSYATGGPVLSSPAVGPDGTVFVGSNDNLVYAIWPNGTLRWTFATGASVFSSPAVDANGAVYVGSEDGYVYAISANGLQLWSVNIGSKVLSSPIVGFQRTIYVTSSSGLLYAIGNLAVPRLTFQESGLTNGTAWNVSLGSITSSSRSSAVTFFVYANLSAAAWTVPTVPCGSGCQFVPSPSSGSLALPHGSTIHISFQQQFLVKVVYNAGTSGHGSGIWRFAGQNLSLRAPTKPFQVFVNWTTSDSALVLGNASAMVTYAIVGGTGTIWANYVPLIGAPLLGG